VDLLRVLIVTHEFPPYFFGGAGTYALDLSNALLAKGAEVIVVCGKSRPPVWEKKSGQFAVLRVGIPELPMRNVWFATLNSEQILKLAKKVDVVHVQPQSASFLIGRITGNSGKPVVATVDGSAREVMRCVCRIPLSKASLAEYAFGVVEAPLRTHMRDLDVTRASHLAVQAVHVKEEILSTHGIGLASKISLIPSAIDFNELQPLLHLREAFSDVRNVVFVGRLYYSKGATFAVHAMKSIVRDIGINDIVLSVIGTGPAMPQLKKFIQKYDLQDSVRFLGHLSRRSALKTMANANALVLPSLYEACPRVLLEAKALGLPTVLFDLPWTREFATLGIQSELARPFDHVDLARKMVSACRKERIEGGALTSLRSFDMNEVAGRLIELYSRLRSSWVAQKGR